MLKRLAAFQRQNQLDLALQELDRIERTLFMLDWLEPSIAIELSRHPGNTRSIPLMALGEHLCNHTVRRMSRILPKIVANTVDVTNPASLGLIGSSAVSSAFDPREPTARTLRRGQSSAKLPG
jgi:hypothetical protein